MGITTDNTNKRRNPLTLDTVITAKEAAALLDVSDRMVRIMCSQGKLKARNANGTWLIDKRSLPQTER